MSTRKKLLGSETRVFVSRSLLKMSAVTDSRGRPVFRGSFTPDSDDPGILVFLDMFPEEPFPHLCRYTFVRVTGKTEIVDATHGPALDLTLEVVYS